MECPKSGWGAPLLLFPLLEAELPREKGYCAWNECECECEE